MIWIRSHIGQVRTLLFGVFVSLMVQSVAAQAPAGEENVAFLRRVQQSRRLVGVKRISWDQGSRSPSMLVGTNLLTTAGAVVPMVKAPTGEDVADYAQGGINVMAGLAGVYGIADAQQELAAGRVELDRSGYRHVSVKQRHGGVPVVGGTTIVHFDAAGNCRRVNGRFVADLAIDPEPALSIDAAESAALAAAAGQSFNGARIFGETKLVVWARDGVRVLAYWIWIVYDHADGGMGEWRYVVDARTGEIVRHYDNIREITEPGVNGRHEPVTGQILRSEGGGTNEVQGWSDFATGAFYLWNTTEAWGIYNVGNSGPDAGTYCYRMANTWADSDTAAMSTAFNFSETLDYFRTVHGRNSFDGDGTLARANVHAPGVYRNAYWSPAEQQFTFGDDYDYYYEYDEDGWIVDYEYDYSGMGVLDVAAHEFTHAVTEHTAGLIYQGESGALNESFSDIFGAAVEFHVQPDGTDAYDYTNKISGHSDWLMGEDTGGGTNLYSAFRDMRNPHRFGDPSRYEGTYWINPFSRYDYGGVHINSGVQNHFFYLLSEGGIGSNDGLVYDMAPLGLAGAEQVAFATLTGYLEPSSGYPEAREAWLAAAHQLDEAGVTTNAWIPVMAAWAACGVGDAPSVVPDERFVAAMRFAGVAPITPPSKEYMVVNYTSRTQQWDVVASNGVLWLEFEPSSFELPPMSYTTVHVRVVQDVALSLPEAVYRDCIQFDCNEDLYDADRDAYLRCGMNYQMRSTKFEWIDPVLRGHTDLPWGMRTKHLIYFDFGFYELPYSNLYLKSNGTVGFLEEDADTGPQILPDPEISNAIAAPFWTELWGVQGSKMFIGNIGQPPNRYTVLTWLNMKHPDNRDANHSFQVLLREEPGLFGNNDIIFQYLDVNNAYDLIAANQNITVGLEDHEGLVARTYSDVSNPTWVADGQAILFTDYLPPETTPPTGSISVLSSSETDMIMEVNFDELVQGLTAADLSISGNLIETHSVEGGGLRYLIHFSNLGPLGHVAVSIPPDTVVDVAGNTNVVTIGPGLYTKAVGESNVSAGLWVLATTPATVQPDATVDLSFVLYNSTTGTCYGVTADIASAETGLSFPNGTVVTYGDVGPGQQVTSSSLTVTVADAASILSNPIRLSHTARCRDGMLNADEVDLPVDGLIVPTGLAEIEAATTRSVMDWRGVPLSGDGSAQASYFQLLSAGVDGVVNLPGAGGAPSGDDKLLYTKGATVPYGRFGVGLAVPSDLGKFEQPFLHSLSAGTLVYVRAWDGASYSDSIAYGESGTYAVNVFASQSFDFGSWVVGTPVDMTRDLNGDSVPDGYDVFRGADARVPIEPLDPDWTAEGIAGELGSGAGQMLRPGRVVEWGGYVFVADTENSRIQTWSADLSTLVSTYTGDGVAAAELNCPQGLDVDAVAGRLVVADTKHDRVVLLAIDAGSGALSYLQSFALPAGNELDQPFDVAVSPSQQIYVVDTYNNRVVCLSSTGALQWARGVQGNALGNFYFPRGIAYGPDGRLYVADSQNHRVQILATTGYPSRQLSGGGEGLAFSSPSDVGFDPGGRMYVVDTGNHRVQVFSGALDFLAAYKPPSGELGSAPGQLRSPQGVFPSLDGSGVYVADTWNNRVQRLILQLDADGDGMSDPWEDANGLDSSDPSDASEDPDGDGVSNLGEYRAGTDPHNRDTNDDGISDGVSMGIPLDATGAFPPHEGIQIDAVGEKMAMDVLAWEAEAGAVYKLEMSLNLPETEWLPQATVTVQQAGTVSWTNSAPPLTSRHFYRIRKEL